MVKTETEKRFEQAVVKIRNLKRFSTDDLDEFFKTAWSLQNQYKEKIKDLTKSRDNWKKKADLFKHDWLETQKELKRLEGEE